MKLGAEDNSVITTEDKSVMPVRRAPEPLTQDLEDDAVPAAAVHCVRATWNMCLI